MLSVFVLFAVPPLLSGCDLVVPTNPFDPSTPVGLQAPGHLVGLVALQSASCPPDDLDARWLAYACVCSMSKGAG
ncbi:MAG: hypothetical protein FJ137_08785 [Deltaproteobacteria bacterium]|nr:hypothetical protein [Deltaproteobacteria bacterium]